ILGGNRSAVGIVAGEGGLAIAVDGLDDIASRIINRLRQVAVRILLSDLLIKRIVGVFCGPAALVCGLCYVAHEVVGRFRGEAVPVDSAYRPVVGIVLGLIGSSLSVNGLDDVAVLVVNV